MTSKTKLFISIFLTAFVFVFLGIGMAYAQGFGFQEGAASGLPNEDLRIISMNIVKNMLSILGIIFLVIIIYAGFTWMTAGGNDEKVGEAKKWLTRGVIGLAIILASYSITLFITSTLVKSSMPQGGESWSLNDLF